MNSVRDLNKVILSDYYIMILMNDPALWVNFMIINPDHKVRQQQKNQVFSEYSETKVGILGNEADLKTPIPHLGLLS